jgi:DNA/RNA endonuclease YhcR with UshA esterase domain
VDSRKILALSLAAGMLSTLVLYAYAWTVNPMTVGIGEIGSDDVGSFVRTQGHVRKIAAVGGGGFQIELVDYSDFAAITVFLPGKVARSIQFMEKIVPGAKLRVAGEVQEFGGEVEIAVSDATIVQLLAGAEENRLGLDTLASNPETFDGMQVLVGGEIAEIASAVDWDKMLIHSDGDSFWVDDAERNGARGNVDVFGLLLYNEERRRFEIKVAGQSDAIAPHPSDVPESYAIVTIRELAATPDAWEGRYVAVLGVETMAGEIIGTSFTLADAAGGERYYISCMIFGWGWSTDKRGMAGGVAAEFLGTWGYYSREAQWQVTSGEFTLRL